MIKFDATHVLKIARIQWNFLFKYLAFFTDHFMTVFNLKKKLFNALWLRADVIVTRHSNDKAVYSNAMNSA